MLLAVSMASDSYKQLFVDTILLPSVRVLYPKASPGLKFVDFHWIFFGRGDRVILHVYSDYFLITDASKTKNMKWKLILWNKKDKNLIFTKPHFPLINKQFTFILSFMWEGLLYHYQFVHNLSTKWKWCVWYLNNKISFRHMIVVLFFKYLHLTFLTYDSLWYCYNV